MNEPSTERPSGLPHAIGAYLIWGVLPLYLKLVSHVPPVEFVGWRVICTLPFCLIVLAFRGELAHAGRALVNRRVLPLLMVSALLIGANWLIYVIAIQAGHVLAASLGYYINPLVNVLLGTVFLKERMSRPQWLAVALASIAVSLLAWGARDMLGISLSLAGTFAAYGLVRKFTPVGGVDGLTVESLLLLLPAIGLVSWFALSPAGIHFGQDWQTTGLIVGAGAVTAIPLILFAIAARRLSFSTLGFVQFVAPTLAFLSAVLVFHEPLRPLQLACFLLIWAAIGIFSWDMWRRRDLKAGR